MIVHTSLSPETYRWCCVLVRSITTYLNGVDPFTPPLNLLVGVKVALSFSDFISSLVALTPSSAVTDLTASLYVWGTLLHTIINVSLPVNMK